MEIYSVLPLFGISPKNISRLGTGHINRTFMVEDITERRYILQGLNNSVFCRPEKVMENISSVSALFGENENVLIPSFLKSGDRNFVMAENTLWRIYPFAENSSDGKNIYSIGFSFGTFQKKLNSVPLELHETISGFHDFEAYYNKLVRVVPEKYNRMEKFRLVKNEIQTIFSDVPKRYIHGDAKADNVIIGEKCTVIDLDTMIESYSALDYGDMVRSLCREKVDTDIISELTEGYAKGLDGLLTEKEIHSLYYGIIWVVCELAVRYLTDCFSGENYFGKTPEKCLERYNELMIQLDAFTERKAEICSLISEIFKKLCR